MSSNPDHILRSLHWLEVQERIKYKVISTTYKLLQSASATLHYLRDVITVQPWRVTWSSSLVTVLRPPVQSSLEIRYHSFPQLWNELLFLFVFPDGYVTQLSSISGYDSGPVQLFTRLMGVFHSRLKTHLSSKCFSSVAFSLSWRWPAGVWNLWRL